MKKRAAIVLILALCGALLVSACAPKAIGEAKAKEIGLAYINQVFDVNETEATVISEQVECFPYQDGAIVTGGDASIATRLIYRVRVAKSESMPLYLVLVNGSTGEVYSAWRSERNIIMTPEQWKEANARIPASWGKNKELIYEDMRQASINWVSSKLMGDYPVLFGAQNSNYEKGPINPTFKNSYYVVMGDGTAYEILIQWPSMQVLSVTWMNG